MFKKKKKKRTIGTRKLLIWVQICLLFCLSKVNFLSLLAAEMKLAVYAVGHHTYCYNREEVKHSETLTRRHRQS